MISIKKIKQNEIVETGLKDAPIMSLAFSNIYMEHASSSPTT